MGTYRSLKNSGNWPPKECKMGLAGKNRKTSPGRALFTMQRSRALSEGIPLPSPLIIEIL